MLGSVQAGDGLATWVPDLVLVRPGAPSSLLLLVAMPLVTSSFMLLVVMPGAPSSVLATANVQNLFERLMFVKYVCVCNSDFCLMFFHFCESAKQKSLNSRSSMYSTLHVRPLRFKKSPHGSGAEKVSTQGLVLTGAPL